MEKEGEEKDGDNLMREGLKRETMRSMWHGRGGDIHVRETFTEEVTSELSLEE